MNISMGPLGTVIQELLFSHHFKKEISMLEYFVTFEIKKRAS